MPLLPLPPLPHLQVYDVTSYIDDHPGGAESILLNAGVDCTDEFMGVHSQVYELDLDIVQLDLHYVLNCVLPWLVRLDTQHGSVRLTAG
jgi:hypothetical protein